MVASKPLLNVEDVIVDMAMQLEVRTAGNTHDLRLYQDRPSEPYSLLVSSWIDLNRFDGFQVFEFSPGPPVRLPQSE